MEKVDCPKSRQRLCGQTVDTFKDSFKKTEMDTTQSYVVGVGELAKDHMMTFWDRITIFLTI